MDQQPSSHVPQWSVGQVVQVTLVVVAVVVAFWLLFYYRVCEMAQLRERLRGIKEMSASLPPETSNLIDRLERLMDKTS